MSDERTLDLLEAKIQELQSLNEIDGMDLGSEIAKLEQRLEDLRRELYASLSDWERVRIARNPKRPYALDYIDEVFGGFYELHGDRIAGDDRALLALGEFVLQCLEIYLRQINPVLFSIGRRRLPDHIALCVDGRFEIDL